MSRTTVYRHRELGFELELPPAAEVREDVPGIACAILEPEGDHELFRANVAITCEPLAPGTGLRAFTDASLAAQRLALRSFQLLDRELLQRDGGELVERTLAHHDVDGRAVVVEQWRWVVEQRGYVVTASCAALDHPGLAAAFASLAASFRPEAPR